MASRTAVRERRSNSRGSLEETSGFGVALELVGLAVVWVTVSRIPEDGTGC